MFPDAIETDPVHEFKNGGDDPALNDAGYRMGRRGHIREKGEHRSLGFRSGEQPESYGRNYRQCSFRTRDEVSEVVAGDSFHGLPAGSDYFAGRESHGEAEHIVPGHAVLDGPQSSGTFGYIPPDRRYVPAGRIRRIKKPDLFNGFLEVGSNDPGFHFGYKVLLVDSQDAVHVLQ